MVTNNIHRIPQLIGLSVLAGILTCTSVFAGPAGQGKVRWSESRITLDVQQGDRVVREVEFSVDRNIGPIHIEPVPSIDDIVSIEPYQLEVLEPGVLYTVQFVVAPSAETRVGVHAGTIHLRSGNATIPDTLKIKLNVEEGQSDDDYISSGRVSLAGVAVDRFNSTYDTVGFSLSGAVYSSNPEEIQVYHQGWPVPDSEVTFSSNMLTVAPPRLVPGKNDLILVANDTDGKLLYEEYTLWAGNHTLQGYVVDEYYQAVSDTTVVIKLGDNQTVTNHTVAVEGQFSFSNLPARTVILEATTPDNLRMGSVAANGGQWIVYLPTRDFYPPSPIENNDFTQGLAGWNIGTAPVWLVPHEEESQIQALSLSSQTNDAKLSESIISLPAAEKSRAEIHDSLNQKPGVTPVTISSKSEIDITNVMQQQQQQQNTDLRLATSGEGPQTISRTFNTSQGTRNVVVRYRFITTEIPGGYFGTQYNDYFNITIRSGLGDSITRSNSMNGLGRGAFDSSGRTSWREHTLPVNPEGDTVQFDLTVANVADGWLDSYLVVDYLEETGLAITAMQLHDIDGNNLEYLSASGHTYFEGNTRIHGTVTVAGAEEDTLELLELQVIQNGQVAATATLATDAETTLLQPFGEDGEVSIDTSQLLFNLVPPGGIDASNNGTLSLRALARTQQGEEVTHDLGTAIILRRFLGENRYGSRDEAEGGDDWAQPSVADFIDFWGNLVWGDFSNMNGGPFPPHASHRTGNDVDGWFNGYNARDANTAETILGHLTSNQGSRIAIVFVTYRAQRGNTFYDAIRGVTLNDGRNATDVIQPVNGHTGHFHWRVTDE